MSRTGLHVCTLQPSRSVQGICRTKDGWGLVAALGSWAALGCTRNVGSGFDRKVSVKFHRYGSHRINLTVTFRSNSLPTFQVHPNIQFPVIVKARSEGCILVDEIHRMSHPPCVPSAPSPPTTLPACLFELPAKSRPDFKIDRVNLFLCSRSRLSFICAHSLASYACETKGYEV